MINLKSIKDIEEEEVILFCDSNLNSWIHHREIIQDKSDDNLSFIICDNNRIIGFCPIVLETRMDNNNKFKVGSLMELSLPSPILDNNITNEKQVDKYRKIMYEHMDKLSQENNIAKISYNFSSYYYNMEKENIEIIELNKYGFLNASLKMILINLKEAKETLWTKISKGHKSTIKKYLDKIRCEYISNKNKGFSFDKFSSISLVKKYNNKIVRYLLGLYNRDCLEICNLLYDGEIIGRALFLKYANVVQYFSAERLVTGNMPVHHLMLWKAMEKYKREGFSVVDMGVFSYTSQINYTASEKTNNIALFKRGFGGRIVPFIIGEKYYDPMYFEHEFINRMLKYKRVITGPYSQINM